MKKRYIIFQCIIALIVIACENKRDQQVVDQTKINEELKDSSYSLRKKLINVIDSNELDISFNELELPITLDSALFRKMVNGEFERINNLNFFKLNDLKEIYNELPLNVFYSMGKFSINDSTVAYIILTDINHENPVDMYFMSSNIVIKSSNKIIEELLLSKYHAYSGIIEEYYSTIQKDLLIEQVFRIRGNIDEFSIDSTSVRKYNINESGKIEVSH